MAFHETSVEVMLPADKLQARIAELGAQITKDYQGKELTLIGIMKGSIFFLTDLARQVDLPITIELMGVSSYQGGTETTGEVRITNDLTKPMHGRHVIIVEDIIDTGLTLNYLVRYLRGKNPRTLRICTLLDKPARRLVDIPVDYVGFTIPDQFVVGYGLDYGEYYRNLRFVGVLRPEVYTSPE